MIIELEIKESDIIKAINILTYTPLHFCVARHFKDHPSNIEVNYDSVIIWDDEINDYDTYKYCEEDIEKIKYFLDDWFDFQAEKVEYFFSDPIKFCVQQK